MQAESRPSFHVMADLKDYPVIVLVGATAVGKTACSLALAEQLDAEIVSVDSRQIYRYMDIGTAKPTVEERARIPHHLVDCLEPTVTYSAGRYASEAQTIIADILQRGRRALVVGGAGFYLQALMDGLFQEPEKNQDIRSALRQRAREELPENLHAELAKIDPDAASVLSTNDVQRVVRALEVAYSSGVPMSTLHRNQTLKPLAWPARWFGLRRDRAELYDRINRRVDVMMQDGLLAEAKDLLDRGFKPELEALRTVGYQEIFAHFAGEYTLEKAHQLIQQHTRNYAKRQYTWFRKESRITWIDMQPATIGGDVVDEIMANILHESQ
jgi:tRNA dimethylallyltransferase